LSVSSFGSYSLAFVLVGFATTFGFSWSSSSILFFGSKEKAETGSINKSFWARNIILFGSFLIITLTFLVSRHWIDSYVDNKVSWLIYFWVLARVIEDYFFHYFLAIKKQLLGSAMMFLSKIFLLVMVLLIPLSVEKIIYLNVLSSGLSILYIFGINKKDIGSFEFDRGTFKAILNFSLWQLFGFSGLYIINFGDNIVIKHFMTTSDVAIYNAGYKLFEGVANIAFTIVAFFSPHISSAFKSNDRQYLNKFFYKERYIIFSFVVAIHVIIIFLAKPLILQTYGSKYTSAILPLQILMIGSILRYYSSFYVIFSNIKAYHKSLQVVNVFRSIMNIMLDILLVFLFGILGAAIATSVSILISTIIMHLLYEKKMKYIMIQGGL